MKGTVLGVFILSITLLFLYFFRDTLFAFLYVPRNDKPVATQPSSAIPTDKKDIEIVAVNLTIPWEIAFLPDRSMLVTQRDGKLLKIGTETKIIKEIEGVRHTSEGGLLGLVLHPNFSENNFIYLYLTTEENGTITNQVERYVYRDDTLFDRKVILQGIKGSANHDGGRIAFGPDGYLYITTGDAQTPTLAQDKNLLNGKILRITDDGGIPSDNPFDNAVYSVGHRNPQGLAWAADGTLWATEHGPSGLETGNDEVNIITKGSNYGWPNLRGMETRDGFVAPVLESGRSDTWAPSGMAYWDGSLFFSGLRGETLYEAKIMDGNTLQLSSHFVGDFGRIRAVTLGPDGSLYISTSNKDGRGVPQTDDDRIIKVNPQVFR